MVAFALISTHGMKYFEPESYKEVVGCEDSKKWRLAMEEEMALESNLRVSFKTKEAENYQLQVDIQGERGSLTE